MIQIDLLIPTYNRSKELIENLVFLKGEIGKLSTNFSVRIIISDNASTDETQSVLNDFISENSGIKILYNRNTENIGLEKNMVKVLSLAESDFILWCGDDDTFQKGYLEYCFETLQKKPNIGLQITGINKVDEKGEITSVRNENFEEKEFKAGLAVVLEYSYLGHQLSGLLMKRETLLEDYLATGENRNMYMFIYFLTNRMLKYDVLYAPKFLTAVPVFNEKDWSYNKLGLLDEILKAYAPFEKEIGKKNVMKLVLKVIKLQADFRLGIQKKNPFKLVKQYFQLIRMVNYNFYFSVKLAFLLPRIYISILKRK